MISFPSASTIVSSSTADASTWVTTFLPVLYFVLPLVVGVGIVLFLKKKAGGATARVLKR